MLNVNRFRRTTLLLLAVLILLFAGAISASAESPILTPTKAPTGPPDLTIAKTHKGSFKQGQIGATYTIKVTNSGSGPTSGDVTVTDALPDGLTATSMTGSGWTCAPATLTCVNKKALKAKASYPPITLKVNVDAEAPASVTNTATVSGGGETNTDNDTANDVTAITPVAPDLTISKKHSGKFKMGQIGATYTIKVTNSGNGSTTGNVTVEDTLPNGLTATSITGSGWSCDPATLTCTISKTLKAKASYPPIKLKVNVASAPPASITNTVTVSGGGERNTGNNTANDVVIMFIDNTPPTVTEFTVPSTSDSLTVPITSFAATDNSEVAGYLVTQTSTKPLATDSGWKSSAPSSYTSTTTGNMTLYAWAKDGSGNISLPKSASVTISAVQLPRTGQTTSYGTRDDGALQMGVAWPNPRFTDNGNGAVTDNLTGLIWLKDADCFGAVDWDNALASANGLASGLCGLSDGSKTGDWRLPNRKELQSLIDRSMYDPALPAGQPFSNVQAAYYCSSSSFAYSSNLAWIVYMYDGEVDYYNGYKLYRYYYVWPVRSGQ